jgi:hypothetical protein
MNFPRRQFLRLAGAAVAAPVAGPVSSVGAAPAPVLIEKLDIKREEIQQIPNTKGAFFGETADAQESAPTGRTLSWRIRGGGSRDIAWQLADVGVAVVRRPSMSIDPLEVTFRCTIWSRGYDSTLTANGGCYLEIVLSNKDGLTLNHVPLTLAGFDIRCQFRGSNLILPSLSYQPLTHAMFDEISHIQLFDRGGSAHKDVRYIAASACAEK